VAPAIYASLPYDAAEDFAGVVSFGRLPIVLSYHLEGDQDRPATRRKGQGQPGTMTYALGRHRLGHSSRVEKLKLSAGFTATHMPFRGGPEALAEVVAGHVDFYLCPINTALPFIREGKLIALLTSDTKRSADLPTCRPRPRSVTGTPNCRSGSGCSRPPRRRARFGRPRPGSARREGQPTAWCVAGEERDELALADKSKAVLIGQR